MTLASFHGYAVAPTGGIDQFLERELLPWVGDHAFFFVRWSRPTPHLRLRVARSLAPATVLGAPFAVRRASYRPDSRRMGGRASVPLAHAVDVASSRLVCTLLRAGVPPRAGALVAGATLIANGFPEERRADAVATILDALYDVVGADDKTRARFESSVSFDEACNSQLAPFVSSVLEGVELPEPLTALAEAVCALTVSIRGPEQRWRTVLRQLHLVHNRFGLEGWSELGALIRLRAFVGRERRS